jgi:hypothetical protein
MSIASQSGAGQDAHVAVLQAQQVSLENTLRDLSKNVNDGFAAMATKMDRINEITTSIAAITARQEGHSDGLARAFAELKSVNERLAQVIDENNSWRDVYAKAVDDRFDGVRQAQITHVTEHAKEHVAINSQISQWRGMVLGGGAVLSLLTGLIAWVGGKYVTTQETHSRDIRILESRVDRLPYPTTRTTTGGPPQ